MDPHDMFARDRAKFDEDLADLINAAAANASSATQSPSTHPTTPSPSMDSRSHHYASPGLTSAKRIKIETMVQDEDAVAQLNVHPSRRTLLMLPSTAIQSDNSSPFPNNRGNPHTPTKKPFIERTGANMLPVGGAMKRKASNSLRANPAKRRDSTLSSSSVSNGPGSASLDQVHVKDKIQSSTLRSVVQRQWDPSMDELPYELLLEKRRTEHLSSNVDRYVPASTHKISSTARPSSSSPFMDLPEAIRAKILDLLLVSDEPIVVDFTWLRSFVNGHCRVPIVEKAVRDNTSSAYTVPIEWDQLTRDVNIMRKDCIPFKPALEDRGNKTRKRKAPCRGLTTGLLTVSKELHAQAATVFYGSNTFRFPVPTCAWMQLESFLATIGSVNVGKLRNITIHCPLWHRGIKEDFLEGAILDLTSPATRFGVVKSPSRDRLLSAIAGSVEALSKAGNLETFALELEHGLNAERWAGSYSNNRRLIAMAEADEHVLRKLEGVRLLKEMSESLSIPPVLTIYHQTPVICKHDLSEFRSRLASIIREAVKHGWKVDQRLQHRRG